MNAEKRAINAAGNVARSLRTYPTSNGKVFGFNLGDYAVGLDASGNRLYSGIPIRGERIIRQPIKIDHGDMGGSEMPTRSRRIIEEPNI